MKHEYEILSVEDRIAAMILAAAYTTEHIDLVVRIGPPENPKKAKDQKAVAERQLKELHERIAGPTFEYYKTYPDAMVIYRAEKIARDAEPANVSEIGYDTVAVVVANKTLFVASNFKVRIVPPLPDTVKCEISYVAYGPPSPGGQANAVQMLKDELGLSPAELAGKDADRLAAVHRVVFIGPAQPPSGPFEAAAPHAEMQLLSHLGSLKIPVSELTVGVSKACCARCSKALGDAAVKFTARPGNENPKNWTEPSKIPTKVAATYDCKLKLK